MNRKGPGGKLPNWNVGRLHLVPADDVDPYVDPSLDTPDRLRARGYAPQGSDDELHEVVYRPEITVRIWAASYEAAVLAAVRGTVIDTSAVEGLAGRHSVSPAVEVE